MMEITDWLDEQTFYPFTLTVAANNPPTMTSAYAPTHTLESLTTFSFTHSKTLFLESDAGDFIESVFMLYDDGTALPDWIQYNPAT